MPQVSDKFIQAVKLDKRPQYKIALAAGVHPDTLSKIINGQIIIQDGDRRVVEVGKLLGLTPAQLFRKGAGHGRNARNGSGTR